MNTRTRSAQLWYWRGVASASLHAGNVYASWEALLRSVWEADDAPA